MTYDLYAVPEPTHPLTDDQAFYARACVDKWLRIRGEAIADTVLDVMNSPHDPAVVAVDAAHSALLHRLLTGKPALPEPPPLRDGYPDYEAVG